MIAQCFLSKLYDIFGEGVQGGSLVPTKFWLMGFKMRQLRQNDLALRSHPRRLPRRPSARIINQLCPTGMSRRMTGMIGFVKNFASSTCTSWRKWVCHVEPCRVQINSTVVGTATLFVLAKQYLNLVLVLYLFGLAKQHITNISRSGFICSV